MERCPNCGAPARPGAKFCTTCGYRLPVTAPVASSRDSDETAGTGAAASWPAPPEQATESATPDEAREEASLSDSPAAEDEVIIIAPSTAESGPREHSREATASAAAEPASTTDSVLSSSWPSSTSSSQGSSWVSYGETPDSRDASDLAGGYQQGEPDTDGAPETTTEIDVAEESVVVAEPASQYEGWSAAVVEEVTTGTSAEGTSIARATALLDELRQLLPALTVSTSTELSEAVADELATALAGGRETATDRESLRAALTEARDNPRDIQSLVALSHQADAALALLDDYDRLADAAQRAIDALRPVSSRG